MRVKLPGGSLPMIVRVSTPRRCSASACSSACSITAPQKDQEYGTTIPTFIAAQDTEVQPVSRNVCADFEKVGSSFACSRGVVVNVTTYRDDPCFTRYWLMNAVKRPPCRLNVAR